VEDKIQSEKTAERPVATIREIGSHSRQRRQKQLPRSQAVWNSYSFYHKNNKFAGISIFFFFLMHVLIAN
jgi:hypothetical protein